MTGPATQAAARTPATEPVGSLFELRVHLAAYLSHLETNASRPGRPMSREQRQRHGGELDAIRMVIELIGGEPVEFVGLIGGQPVELVA